MLALETVEIDVAGAGGLQPTSITISIGADRAARAFEAKLAIDKITGPALLEAFRQSPPCRILASGTLVLTGHVEKASPRFDADAYELTISGRSKTGDAIDSAHNHKTGEFRNKAPKDIVAELAKEQGVEIDGGGGASQREVFRLSPGETIFTAAERLARRDGFSITDTAEGKLHLFDRPTERHAGSLIEGVNVFSASAVFDATKRFARTSVKGQTPIDHGAENLEFEAEVTDENGARARRRIVVAPEFLRSQDARKRAEHHRDRAAGRGTTAEAVVSGWRDRAGEIWAPRKLVYVESPLLGLSQVMMIEGAVLKQSERDGTITDLSLVDPRAYGGKGAKGNKSGKQWSMTNLGGDAPSPDPAPASAPFVPSLLL
jgi:prophage tail gpP-like protein